jgi:hypothetical protein
MDVSKGSGVDEVLCCKSQRTSHSEPCFSHHSNYDRSKSQYCDEQDAVPMLHKPMWTSEVCTTDIRQCMIVYHNLDVMGVNMWPSVENSRC